MTKRNSYLLKKYGITEDVYEKLLHEQGESCGVCGKHQSQFKARLCVDHDHETGDVRGLLCIYCNRRIVSRYRIGNGSANLLLAAYNYLTRDYPGYIVPKKIKKRKKRRCRNKKQKKPQKAG